MNIYQKVNKIREAVAYIKKDATVQGYKAVTHDMVTAMLREELIKHGIIIVPSLIEDSVTEGATSSGKFKLRYEAKYSINFINADNPDEVISMVMPAHADDNADKAPGKATSYATKYAMLKLFSIETGENEESRIEQFKPVETISEDQKATLMALAEEVEANTVKFLKWAHKGDSRKTWSDIPSKEYDACVDALQKKRAK